MARTSISLNDKTAACLRYLAQQDRRSVSNLVERLTWDALRDYTNHWKPEEIEQLLDSFADPSLEQSDGQLQPA